MTDATAELVPTGEQSDTLIATDRDALPPMIRDILEPGRPLPVGVQFFEKHIKTSDLIAPVLWAGGLGLLGLISIVFGMAIIIEPRKTVYDSPSYWPLGFGFVCIIAVWIMLSTVRERWRIMTVQSAGKHVRVGICLTDECLIEAAETSTTVIPRSQFRGVQGATVKYLLNGQEKAIRIGGNFVETNAASVLTAIDQWLRR